MNKTNLSGAIGIVASVLCSFHTTAAPSLDPSKIDDKVAITLGQKLSVQFKAREGSLGTPKIVEQPDPKQPGVILDFQKYGETLTLHIKNGFPQTLHVRCLMRLKRQETYSETSIIPIPPGLGDVEVGAIRLKNLSCSIFGYPNEAEPSDGVNEEKPEGKIKNYDGKTLPRASGR